MHAIHKGGSAMDKEKIVLITGAAGGIGSAAVAKFSQCGWKVIGVATP
jgi:NAD(P)-dependent dehydrogenase (short-subunit alcohol dehydrogenase family)